MNEVKKASELTGAKDLGYFSISELVIETSFETYSRTVSDRFYSDRFDMEEFVQSYLMSLEHIYFNPFDDEINFDPEVCFSSDSPVKCSFYVHIPFSHCESFDDCIAICNRFSSYSHSIYKVFFDYLADHEYVAEMSDLKFNSFFDTRFQFHNATGDKNERS